MKLEGDQNKKALAWINEKRKSNFACPACGAQAWQLLDRLFEVRAFDTGAPLVPFAVIACGNCGNMQFFNAIHMGIVKRTPVAAETDVPEPSKGGDAK